MHLEHQHSRAQLKLNAGGADLPRPPARTPPPLPRSAPSVEAFTVRESHYHRSRAATTLVLAASTALLLIPILASNQLPARTAAAGMPEIDTAVMEQFFVLDEVLIKSTNDEGGEGGPERCVNDPLGVSALTAAEL